MKTVNLVVNGRSAVAAVEPRTHLADFLREYRHLTGTHLGCEHGVCGACTVLIDGIPARSCITYAVACEGAEVTTIEGFERDEIMGELREAFSREHALQCGFCTPGMLIAARDVVIRLDRPSERDVRVAMSGNLCRCTGYVGIIRAIMGVLASRRDRGIAANPSAGRTILGPAGSGHGAATMREPSAAHVRKPAAPVQAGGAGTMPAADASTHFTPQVTFDESFDVPFPREQVWAFFSRTEAVAACLPGASLEGDPEGAEVAGSMRVKVGPIRAEFGGRATIERDPATFSGTIRGSGRDQRSASATRGVVHYLLLAKDEGRATTVKLQIGYTLTGALAQFSRSDLMRDISGRLIKAFVQNLEAQLAGKPGEVSAVPVRELNAGALVFSVLGARIQRWWRALFGAGGGRQ